MTTTSLQQEFIAAICRYAADSDLATALWEELRALYTQESRHYHTLEHLEHIFGSLAGHEEEIGDREALLFALAYHDAVYDTARNDNEDRSAALAVQRLSGIHFPRERAARCEAHIRATKGHAVARDPDTNLFTDADLSILGAEPWRYRDYASKIRLEYAQYPDASYRAGRRNVLKSFLAMERIFKTRGFYERYESQARENILSELKELEE